RMAPRRPTRHGAGYWPGTEKRRSSMLLRQPRNLYSALDVGPHRHVGTFHTVDDLRHPEVAGNAAERIGFRPVDPPFADQKINHLQHGFADGLVEILVETMGDPELRRLENRILHRPARIVDAL